MIPIPVVGAVIGALADRMVTGFCKRLLGEDTHLARQVEQYYQQSLTQIDRAYKAVVANFIATYERLGNLAEAAFGPNLNLDLRLQASIELAEAYGIPDSKLVHNSRKLCYSRFGFKLRSIHRTGYCT
ncbi:MAG: hypothetical protein MUE44_20755 [Oscillatoriaceae cyanobacterium Prado104]|nr:hypothetical protein [Oscillatoriaceae cyanobacterium Prado104]